MDDFYSTIHPIPFTAIPSPPFQLHQHSYNTLSKELTRARHCYWTMWSHFRNLLVAVRRRSGRWLAASHLGIRYGLLGVVKIMIYNRAWCWRFRRPLRKRYLKHLPDPLTDTSRSSFSSSSSSSSFYSSSDSTTSLPFTTCSETFENQILPNTFVWGRIAQHKPLPRFNRFMSFALYSLLHPLTRRISYTLGPLTITLILGKP